MGTDFVVLQIRANTAQARTATFMGRAFRVVPSVLVRSQVLHNNLGAAFLPPEEITPEWAQQWNGVPVLVGPHPSRLGQPVSGRSPELWDARGAGWIFNARAETSSDNTRRLRAEVWLDIARKDEVEGLGAVLEHIDAGTVVELSTGFPTNTESHAGNFHGAAYTLVLRPQGVDHLVVSTEMVGACSVLDGCGLGTNAETPATNILNVARRPTFAGVEDGPWTTPTLADFVEGLALRGIQSVRDLTPEERRRIAEHSMLGDPSATTIDGLSYLTVVNPRTGKLNMRALRGLLRGRGAPGVQNIARRTRDSATIMARRLLRDDVPAPTQNSAVGALARRVGSLLTGAEEARATMRLWSTKLAASAADTHATNETPADLTPPTAWEENLASKLEREAAINAAIPTSDSDHMMQLREALQSKFGGGDRSVCLVDVFSTATPPLAVYFYSTPFGPNPPGSEYFQCAYEENAEGAITFSDPVRVRRMTTYVAVAATADQSTTNSNQSPCAQRAAAEAQMITDNEKKDLLAELVSAVNAAIAPITAKLGTVETALAEITAKAATATNEAVNALVTPLAAQLTALTAVVNAERDVERLELVAALAANTRTPFTQAELEAKPLDELRKLAQIIDVPVLNFGARGGPRNSVNASKKIEDSFMPVAPYFAKAAENTTSATAAE